MLFELKEDESNFQQLYLDDEAMMGIITSISEQTEDDAYAPVSLKECWASGVSGEFHQEADSPKNNLIPDITYWYRYFLLSAKAYTALKGELDAFCELLPVETEFGTYYLINISNMTSHIESSISKPSGRLTFSMSTNSEKSVYFETIDDMETYVCTDSFKALVEDSALTGLQFITRSNPELV